MCQVDTYRKRDDNAIVCRKIGHNTCITLRKRLKLLNNVLKKPLKQLGCVHWQVEATAIKLGKLNILMPMNM